MDEFLFDFLRVVAFGEAEAAADAKDMGIDDDPFGDAIKTAEYDVGGLAGDSGKAKQFGHGLGDDAVEF